MTTTSLVTVNALLAALVLVGIVRLLVHGIVSDRRAHQRRPSEIRPLASVEREELAA